MSELHSRVTADLEKTGAEPATIELWEKVCSWYDEGGPSVVEENILATLKEMKTSFAKQVREITEETKLGKLKKKAKKR